LTCEESTDVFYRWRNFTLKSGGDQWRRQDLVSGGHDDRGAEGEEWAGVWGGVRSSADQRVWGSVVSSSCGVWGRAPTAIAFSVYFRPQNASGTRKILFSCPKYKKLLEKLQIPL